jgi:hypothetical protein
LVILVASAGLGLVACSSDGGSGPDRPGPTAVVATRLSCDVDESTDQAKDTIERVGGLVDPAFVVRHAESTRLGIVALVDRHPSQAFAQLNKQYGVAIVATADGDRSHTAGFAQVRRLVASACG